MAEKPKKRFLTFFLILAFLLTGTGLWVYVWVYRSNVELGDRRGEYFYIRDHETYPEVVSNLVERHVIRNRSSFEWVAHLKKYDTNVKPGRYHITEKMSNNTLVNLLRKGDAEPVHFTLNAVRTKEQLASRVGGKLEADSTALLRMLNDDAYLSRFGMNSTTVLTLFIPNTYEFLWVSSAEDFMDQMARDYKKFWSEERRTQAKALGLSQTEVVILASIVQEEQTRYQDERQVIAGLYLNRLKEHMALQSDPTVRYALGDFTLNRVLNEDLHIASPYNTYLHTGLPPGPICFPEPASVDAVLTPAKHKFLYMCAEYGTGRHNFSETFEQHKIYAQRYREALDKNGIKR